MSLTNRFQVRAGIIACALILVLGASIPLLVNAEDATPEVDEAQPEVIEEGANVFQDLCMACHQADGEGFNDVYPALADNPLLDTEDPDYLISTLMTGRGGMPNFAGLTDEDIAAVASYVRVELNDADEVSEDQVEEIRDAIYPPVEEEVVEEATPEDATPEATPEDEDPDDEGVE